MIFDTLLAAAAILAGAMASVAGFGIGSILTPLLAIRVLAKILGHGNPKMTLDRYAHLSPELINEQRRVMDAPAHPFSDKMDHRIGC